MIVGAAPSGAVDNTALGCCEGRKEKVLAGVRGWIFSSMVGWRSLCRHPVHSRDACPFLSPVSVTFWSTPRSVMWLYSCGSPAETQEVQPRHHSVPEEMLR